MRTAIIIGAVIIAITVNEFKPFPGHIIVGIMSLTLIMLIWDVIEYFK